MACMLAIFSGTAAAGPNESTVDKYLEEWQRSNGIPGVAAAVIDGESEDVWLRGNDGHEDPVSSSTPFLIGSVAKTITSTMVLQLVDEGKVELNDPAQKHLDWLDHDAKVEQLLDHTAGYTAKDGLDSSEHYREDLSVTEAAQGLDHSGEIGPYSYSSANYLVLGALIEKVTGVSYPDALHQRVTGPSHMDDTTVDGSAPNLPPGHRLWWGKPVAYQPGNEPSGAPYGYVASTLDDLVSYSRAQLDTDLLTPGMRTAAWNEQAGEQSGYGFGWHIDNGDSSRRIHHTGATPGYFAHVMLIPEENRAIVILANSYSEAQAPSLAAAAGDIDNLFQGGAADPTSGDSLLIALPWIALAVAVLAVATLSVLVVRRRHPRRPMMTVMSVIGSSLVALVLVFTPSLFGMSWHNVRAWMPDAALGLFVGVVGWIAVAVLFVLTGRGTRHRQSRRSNPIH